jgi:N6-L-threonylcarbamoyladenine synthase
MRILAIETSCDDTGIAIVETKGKKAADFDVLANIVSSQAEIHKKYGGVFPMMAKREHQLNLVPTLTQALKDANLLNKSETENNLKQEELNKILEREPELEKQLIPFLKENQKPDVDLIAVTQGPGLEPCLWVGINFARALSFAWKIPIIPVNHIESHILVNYLNNKEIKLPALALVVSGGHTQLILTKKIGSYKILGETRDDAAGECFDKCAKILGLEYPGGPLISKLAEGIKADELLPRPMINTKDYDFSFSGLKTAVLYSWQKNQSMGVAKMAAEVQQAIIDVLVKKTIAAGKDFKVKTIILGGGVSANQELRKQLQNAIKNLNNSTGLVVELLAPQIDHSTDNGLMTAITAYFHKTKKIGWQKLRADANLRISK